MFVNVLWKWFMKMIHISVPSTQTLVDTDGLRKYIVSFFFFSNTFRLNNEKFHIRW